MSSSSDSNKKEDIADSADDPLVEIPRISGNELVKKSQISSMDIRGMVVRCTSCLHQINHHDVDKCMKHYRLNVIVCKECHEFYGTSEFSQDESGNYNYCAWCGNGGKLFLCDFCPHSFCSTCVRRNFGRAEVSRMSKEGWKCYMCNPDKLKAKAEYCELILNYSKNAKIKREKKMTSELLISKISGPLEWTETKDWVLPVFDDIDDSCKSLHKRLEKLKVVGSSQTKSLRHLIKKMEQIVNNHKSELGVLMKSLSTRYVKFIEQRKQAEKLKDEGNNVADKNSTVKLNGNVSDEHDMIDITSENEKEASQDEEKINESNYKAKLSLLEDDSSEISVSDTEAKVEPKDKSEGSVSDAEKNMVDVKIENDKGKLKKTEKIVTENEEKSKKVATGKDKVNSESETENIVTDNAIEKCKKEPKKVVKENNSKESEEMDIDDNNGQSAELFGEETPVVEDTENSTKNLSGGSDDEKKTKVKAVSSKTIQKKPPKPVSRKLDFLDFEAEASSSSSSISDFEISTDTERKKTRQKRTPKKHRSTIKSKVKAPIPVDSNDSKLKHEVRVVLEKCDNLLKEGETTIPVPEEYIFDDLDKQIRSLLRSPKTKENARERKTSVTKKKAAESKSKKPISINGSSSSSICLSSSEDEKKSAFKNKVAEAKEKEDANTLAKKGLLADDSDESSGTSDDSASEEEVVKKKSKKGGKPKSDSSDDFQPRKKKKFDKLLSKRLLSDDDSSNDKERNKEKQAERKKSTKRKRESSDDDSKDKKEKNSD